MSLRYIGEFHQDYVIAKTSEDELNYTIYHLLDTLVPKDYIKEVIPYNDGLPLHVTYSILILDVNSISPINMDWRLDFLVTETWRDDRLQPNAFIKSVKYTNEFIPLPSSFKDKIWQPDPFILNAKKFEIIKMKANFESISLYKNKRIVYIGRFAAIMSCQMSFANFPNDFQVCPITIISYGYSNTRLVLDWDSNNPIVVNNDLKLLQYEMERPIKVTKDEATIHDRKVSKLEATLIFRRQLKYYVIQTFIPSILVVCLSWLSFWFGLDATPGRVMLCVTSLLTLTTMFQGLDSPPVSYIKAIDVWMIGCMIFVFGTLLEFAVILYMDKKYEQQAKSISRSKVVPVEKHKNVNQRIEAWTTAANNRNVDEVNKEINSANLIKLSTDFSEDFVMKVDYYSRYIFPISFAVFSISFGYFLLQRKF